MIKENKFSFRLPIKKIGMSMVSMSILMICVITMQTAMTMAQSVHDKASASTQSTPDTP